MKTNKIIYWTTTGLVSLAMTASCFMYLSKNPELVTGFNALGLPLYLMPLLGTAKLLGVIALVVPGIKVLKEWAYAGLAFTFIGATYVHIATGTPFVAPLVFLVILGVSYWFKGKMETAGVVA
jgi:hypothetical protein